MMGWRVGGLSPIGSAGRRGLACAVLALIFMGVGVLAPRSAAAAGYVGTELSDVKPEDRAVVANPQPVQLLYQFLTKGAPNAKATKFTKEQVLKTVKESGLFSEVSEAPTPNGAILSVTIDNTLPPGAMTNAVTKGAVTGATLFVVGSNTRDYYTGTIEYVPGPNIEKIKRTANQSIVTQMGLINSAPDDAVKVDGGIVGALNTMVRQVVSNPLNAAAKDPGFAPSGPPVAPSPAAAAPEAAPAAPATPATPATPAAPVTT